MIPVVIVNVIGYARKLPATFCLHGLSIFQIPNRLFNSELKLSKSDGSRPKFTVVKGVFVRFFFNQEFGQSCKKKSLTY